jgi:UDPglucose 6-dehydrogenase
VLIDRALPHLTNGVTIVLMSQVPPGFTRALGGHIRHVRPELQFKLLYLVETLIFGDAVRRALQPARFIVGCAAASTPIPGLFQDRLEKFGCPILPMSYESAELTKVAINLYLVGSVTYTNTLSDLCEAIGADWSEIVPALRLDNRIGEWAYLRPSLGVAGGNLERDLINLRDLCSSNGVDSIYVEALVAYNERRFDWIKRQLRTRVLGRIAKPRIVVWGLTYKKDTDSTKNSPSVRLIRELRKETDASIRVWDPAVTAESLALAVEPTTSRDSALSGADCVVIMNDWEEFVTADLNIVRNELRQPVVIDSVGALEGRRDQMTGIEYVSMGRRA